MFVPLHRISFNLKMNISVLQQILLSNNSNPTAVAAIAASNRMTLQNRQTTLPINPATMVSRMRFNFSFDKFIFSLNKFAQSIRFDRH